jgi:hypothetical protein
LSKMSAWAGGLGSGESWFTSGGLRLEPRRGNARRESAGLSFGFGLRLKNQAYP